MRARTVWLMAACLIGFMVLGPVYAQTNLLTNGGFESGAMAPYGTYGTVTSEVVTECVDAAIPEGPIEGNYCLHLVVPSAGANSWDAGMTDSSHVFEAGKIYTFACFMKSKSGTLQIRMKPERAADPYENYNEVVVTITEEWAEYYTTTGVIPADVSPASPTFHIAFAPGDFWIDGVRFYEGEYVPPDFLKIYTATNPSPADNATDVRRDAVLSWTPGPYAATHNVYLGTNFDDVNDADVGSPLLVGQGQTTASYDPPGLLDFGQTYYWRVDEVNAAPDSTVYRGNVWSFTTEPVLYTVQNITATASIPTAVGSGGPEATVNGSGLTNGQHGTADATMWSGMATAGETPWLQYDFDNVYKLFGIHIWNYNGLYEYLLGFGAKDITIEYATEPNEWTTLGSYQLDRGTSQATYAGQLFDLDGVAARSVRVYIDSTQLGGLQPGLSEIQFLYKPVIAREPQPDVGTTDVDPAVVLSWRPGREAASHQVYFGTDEQAVIDGTALVDTVAQSSYSPGALDLGTDYFWRIDEANDATTPSVWAGPVWNFTTKEYLTLDNFESYTDEEGGEIFATWLDGYDIATNGSVVGHDLPPYAEQTIRHSGRQSMPLFYNNTTGNAGAVSYSETETTLPSAVDLTANGADTLSLYYQGVPTGFAQLADDHIVMNGTGTDIWGTTDQFRFVYKQLTGNGSIVARVDHLDNTNEWAKAGVMIRQILDSDSVMVDGVVAGGGYVALQWRDSRGADMGNPDAGSTDVDTVTLPHWVKLTRTGDVFTFQHSADGVTWVNLVPDVADDPTSVTVTMPQTVYIGLAVCSHDAGTVAGAQFSEIATTGNVSGQWQSAAIGTEQPAGNGIDTFYFAVQDSAGKKATLTNPDPYAVGVGEWTQWAIPLSDLSAAGVNTQSVTKLYLGVGDKDQPSKNVSGVLYIDDIAYGRPLE